MKQNLQQYWQAFWQQRSPAERRTLSIGGGVLLLALLYALLWYPLSQERQRLKTSLPQLRATAALMQVQAQEVARLRQLPAQTSTADLRSAIDKATAGNPLGAPLELMPLDAGRMRVSTSAVSFDAWVAWVKALQAEHGVRVESASVSALTAPGLVKVQAVLTLRGSRS